MNATFEHSIIDFWDVIEPQNIIDEYPTVEAFNEDYELDERLMDIFYQSAEYADDDISEVDKEYINTLLLATMAEHLYGSNAQYYIYGIRFDYMQRQAINIATNNLGYNNIIKGEVK
jgi:hypothetical protein